ncbi:MAG: type VI secretion system-associated FHA domain protein TagH [Pseudomonadota bacterium]
MALQITLVKTPAKVSVSKTSQTFKKQGGSLGRAESNSWVLPDPDKFLSSCHCEILFDANTYFILDLSTNGTFFNNSSEPLGKGTKAPLNDGDFFEVGEYRFSIKVVADQDFAGSSPFASQPILPNSSGSDDIFGSRGHLDPSLVDPFSGNGFLPADFSLGSDSQSADPLLALDNARKGSVKESFGGGMFDSVNNSTPGNIFLGNSQTDHSPSLDQAISWPVASQENLIPEDWGGDFMDEPPMPISSPKVRNDAPFGNPIPTDPFDQSPFDSPVSDLPVKKIEIPLPTPRPIPVAQPRVQPPVQIQTAPVANATPRLPEQHSVATSSAINHRLITAMGLDATKLTAQQSDEISDVVGELMREIVDGMMQVLRSRASIKNEFRMNVTTIQPVENNPLKFSVGVEEALENMFLKKTNAYKKPVDAFREGFQEIGEHQVAMIAGIRFGFERMVERFNPENLEKNFNKHGKGGVIPGMQKAKYWNNYRDYYLSFLDNMESSFQHLFGSDFVNAYEDQLRKLAAARKKNR